MKRVALITYRGVPGLDALDAPLPGALAAEGLTAEVVPWDRPDVDWSSYAAALFRSPWDYFERPAEFSAWLDRTARQTRLFNPPEVIRWNLHKRYLVELSQHGVATVPTEVVPRGAQVTLAELAANRRWKDVVVKPAISAGSWRTARFPDAAALDAQRHFEAVLREGDVLLQPFQPEVLASRELSVVFIDGAPQFAITKRSSFEQDRSHPPDGAPEGTVRAEITSAEVTPEALSLAESALRVAPGAPLLYARADMVRGGDGALQIMELELFDPSLYLADFPFAATALARGLARRLTS